MSANNPHNNFRKRLLAGELMIGTFAKTPSMMLAEVLGQTDLDAVCVDAEHSPFDRRDLDAAIFAYRTAHKPCLVRVPTSAPDQLLNALDCGASGVVIPHVASVEKALACAAASRFGDGGRGYAGSTRAAGYGANTIADNLALNTRETTVIAQIEDLDALPVIEGIAAVDGIDCLFIGMMDLTVALQASNAKAQAVVAAAERICEAAVAANRRVGIFLPDPADIPFWVERGVSLFLLSSDHAFIKQGAARLVSNARQHFS